MKKKGITTFKEYFVYIVIVLCAVSFYTHQFIDKRSEGYTIALKSHKIAKKERTKINKEIIKNSEGTELFNQFQAQNKKTNLLWDDFLKVKKNEKVFGFKSLRYFVERFGLIFCFFIYALYNLIKSISNNKENPGNKLTHVFILSVCFFYFFWIFQQFQDFSKFAYIFMTVISACLIFFALYFLFKDKKTKEERLKTNLMEVAEFTFKNTKPEKREEMLDLIKQIAKNK
jgi:hypothetical protein